MAFTLHRMRGRPYRYPTRAILAELRRVAALVKGHYTLTRFEARSRVCAATVQKRFGTWAKALRRAGLLTRLKPRRQGNKYTWEECYANMDRLWRHYNRAPRKSEANGPPSRIGAETYFHRFGGWRNAIAAYVAYRSGDKSAWPMTGRSAGRQQKAFAYGTALRAQMEALRQELEGPARVGVKLRYRVMLRDRFRCTACGANPAADPAVVLHVDHVDPQSAGGKPTLANLRTLCRPCNIGKGALRDEAALSGTPTDAGQPGFADGGAGGCSRDTARS